MEIKGKLIKKGNIESFGDNGFKVQKFQVDLTSYNPNTGEQYPNKAEFQITQDRINQVKDIAIGSRIAVSFNIRGKDVTKKDGTGEVFIQNLEAYKVALVEAAEQPKTQQEEDNDLPF